jgi:hypothetical protein
MEMLVSDKQTYLLQKLINYGQKSFITFLSDPSVCQFIPVAALLAKS